MKEEIYMLNNFNEINARHEETMRQIEEQQRIFQQQMEENQRQIELAMIAHDNAQVQAILEQQLQQQMLMQQNMLGLL